ncbi:MAG: SCO family protein [Limnohabitans sp.]
MKYFYPCLIACVFSILACSPAKPEFKAIDLTGADYAQGFELQDAFGQRRQLSDFKGKVVVVFFGFTQCPDFCPTTLNEWVQVKKNLADKGDFLQPIFITLDPERDNPELLKAYMAGFDPSFIALIPQPDHLPELAKRYKIYYKKVETGNAGHYTLDHSAGTYIYDTQGRLRLYARYGLGPQAMSQDIAKLLQ